MPDFLGVRDAITKPFYDGVLRHPICPPPKGHPHTSIFHGATESSEGGSLCRIPGALGMRSRSPFTTAFYPIPSAHRQKDVSIRAFSMALQNSGGVRHAIMKPFYDDVLHHPGCRPPKGRPHTSISHGATESSEGGSLCRVFLVLGVYRVLTLKPDSQSVKHAIMKPFYDGVLRHPICPPPKGHPHTSIFHGATESSEGGIPGALGMRSRSPFTKAFYPIPSAHRQKDVSIRAFSMALESSLKGESLCQIPGALGMRSWSPFMTAFYTIQAVHRQKGVSIEGVSIALSP
ncbi:hypothetical protein B9Z19DRAFT_1190353 [Tuber borchii]|uniref:Uncharacterized protein n=1 Tax=Tuber borchii TaxID=42251 RepID=A0A2T7A413_TUBBO|nr:hypothetical protein B9Z19DRAFT_1190353 [Tuber borchii]